MTHQGLIYVVSGCFESTETVLEQSFCPRALTVAQAASAVVSPDPLES